jgi:small subunit ribosomal protein S6
MAPATTTRIAEYELVLMLDPETAEERRDQIAADARKRIEAAATLKGERAWGMRKLAYEIRQRTEADYRFFRFEGASPLLDDLDHNLKITDGVLRFRIFKVEPGSPTIEPPPPVPLGGAASRPAGGRRPRGRGESPPAPAAPPAEESPGAAPGAAAEPAGPANEEPVAGGEGAAELTQPPAEAVEATEQPAGADEHDSA